MIVSYRSVPLVWRSHIRSLEGKGHIGYIRYLLIKRTSTSSLNKELLRLGLTGAEEDHFQAYFEYILYPIIIKYQLKEHYKQYLRVFRGKEFSFEEDFENDDQARKRFCMMTEELKISEFFSDEIKDYFGAANIPSKENGEPVISKERLPNWTDMLTHEKRPLIDGMLADGFSPKMISKQLDEQYDIELSPNAVAAYGKAFMNAKRKDVETALQDLQNEKEELEKQLEEVRKLKADVLTVGERTVIISSIRQNISFLTDRINRMKGHHGHSAFSQGAMEYAQLREIFADVMQRTHRRYRRLDERTEDEVIDPLNKLVGMMAKASDKILSVDTAMKDTTKKSIADEMLEVVMPSLDRVEQEEREALEEYRKEFGIPDHEEDDDILGVEE